MANNCEITGGQVLGCKSVGGVKLSLLGNYDSETDWTVGMTQSIIQGVTASPTFYEFETSAEHAGVNQTGQYSQENGTAFFETDLTLKFTGAFDADMRNSLVTLSRAPLVAIVQSNNGEYYVLGKDSPGEVTEGQGTIGTAFGDMNGVTLTIKYKSKNGMYLMDESVLGDIITPL